MSFLNYENQNELTKRIIWGKSLGFIISIICFSILIFGTTFSTNDLIVWGVLFWYPMLGVYVAILGIYDRHPYFPNLKFGAWRGAVVVAILNTILFLMASEQIKMVFDSLLVQNLSLFSVWLLVVLEGLLVGWIMDYIITKKFGEGRQLLD